MIEKPVQRNVRMFVFISFLFSWPIMFIVDGWLEPMFLAQDNNAAARISVVLGHTIAMLGPALAALYLWRLRHEESPRWSWSQPKYYGIVALAMLAFWTLPGVIGLLAGDTIQSPIETQMWVRIVIMLLLGWISGIGEETGWCAYLLPKLSSQNGKTRAMIVSGVIRGLWHWPVLVAPVLAQVVGGERTVLELLGAGVVIAIQLAFTNVFFGAVLGWIWYDLTRDVTIMLLVAYIDSLWVTQISAIVFYGLGVILLDIVRQEEGLKWKQVFRRANP
jgi:membrane protease YdiL (CAAX protease family)